MVNTFLPYSDFEKCASVLDYRRLGKQRVEAWQIYLALTRKDYGWKNHPIVKQWKGNESGLLKYGLTICKEWIKRGYKDSMRKRFEKELRKHKKINLPSWLGNRELHKSHKSNLLRKDKEFYSRHFKNIPDNLPYKWIRT
jgi:hypothetical protein